jgi:tetratricopeptide (TPR) repeat protein
LPKKTASPRIPTWALALILAALVIFVYAQVASFEFVNFDDPDYTFDNPHIRSGLSLENVEWAFTKSYAANWIPLTWISHMLDYQLFGQRSGMFHLVNMLLHAATTILLFLLLNRLTGALWRSFAVATLFAIHPLHVESVAWIAERKDVLSGLFWCLTIYLYIAYAGRGKLSLYFAVLSAFLLGLLSKPMVVTLPFVLMVLDYWPLKRRAHILEKLPLIALSAAIAFVTFFVQSADKAVSSTTNVPLAIRAANIPIAYVTYLGALFWPSGLAIFYPYRTDPDWILAIASIVLLVIISIAAWISRKRFTYICVGWLWYLIVLLPVIGLIQVGAQSHADRYTYLPSIGIFIIIAWGTNDLIERWPKLRSALIPASLTIAAAFIVLTSIQIRYWHDSASLFEHATAVTDNNYLAYNNLGMAISQIPGRMPDAIADYKESLRIKPDYDLAHYNLGTALSTVPGRSSEAIIELRTALTTRQSDPKVHNNLGKALAQEPGRLSEAIAEYQTALRIDPSLTEARNNLGNALAQTSGGSQGAVANLRTAASENASSAETHFNLATALARSPEHLPEAIAEYRAALHIRPDYAEAHNNLGSALARDGQLPAAINEFNAAIRVRPDYAEAHFNLGTALAQSGKLADAMEHWRATLRSDPKHVQAHYNLGIALAQAGRYKEAIAQIETVMTLAPSPRVQSVLDELRAGK